MGHENEENHGGSSWSRRWGTSFITYNEYSLLTVFNLGIRVHFTSPPPHPKTIRIKTCLQCMIFSSTLVLTVSVPCLDTPPNPQKLWRVNVWSSVRGICISWLKPKEYSLSFTGVQCRLESRWHKGSKWRKRQSTENVSSLVSTANDIIKSSVLLYQSIK